MGETHKCRDNDLEIIKSATGWRAFFNGGQWNGSKSVFVSGGFSIFIDYCPFCGKRLKGEEGDGDGMD